MLHVDIPSRTELERLIDAREAGSVSIYLPTSPVPAEVEASRIELKNLAADAAQRLEGGGADKRAIATVSDALADLDDDAMFWAYQARSLAIFVPRRISPPSVCRIDCPQPSSWPIGSTSSRCSGP